MLYNIRFRLYAISKKYITLHIKVESTGRSYICYYKRGTGFIKINGKYYQRSVNPAGDIGNYGTDFLDNCNESARSFNIVDRFNHIVIADLISTISIIKYQDNRTINGVIDLNKFFRHEYFNEEDNPVTNSNAADSSDETTPQFISLIHDLRTTMGSFIKKA